MSSKAPMIAGSDPIRYSPTLLFVLLIKITIVKKQVTLDKQRNTSLFPEEKVLGNLA